MWKRLRQLNEFSFSDWKILLLSSVLLPLVALSLKLTGLTKTQKVLEQYAPPLLLKQQSPKPSQLQEAHNIARLVNISARHGLYRANCLKQVLVLSFFLNKKQIASILHIGVKKIKTDKLEAHAWIECAGTPLIDSKTNLEQFSSIHSSNSN